MHDRMTAAKTPEERAALMKEHMKLVPDGMSTMGSMCADRGDMGMGGGMSMGSETMDKRMDMMETMVCGSP
jgi:hypothetical protein